MNVFVGPKVVKDMISIILFALQIYNTWGYNKVGPLGS